MGGIRGRSDLDTFRGSGPGPVDAVPGPAIEHSAGVSDFKPVSNKVTSFAKVGLKLLEIWPQGRLSRDVRRRRHTHSVCGQPAAPDIDGFASYEDMKVNRAKLSLNKCEFAPLRSGAAALTGSEVTAATAEALGGVSLGLTEAMATVSSRILEIFVGGKNLATTRGKNQNKLL